MKRARKNNFMVVGAYGRTSLLTLCQEKILRTQIRRNSQFIDLLIRKVDLLANQERCPKDANTLVRLKKQLAIEMSENDTFRRVLAKHLEVKERWRTLPDDLPDPMTFLVDRIRTRRKALIAQMCMK